MSGAAVLSEFQTIEIDRIVPSGTNPRKTRDSQKLDELAESIRAHGVLQPILVRPKGPSYYVSTGHFNSADHLRYVACLNIVGRENLHESFASGTAEENQAAAEQAIEEKNAARGYEIVAGERRWRASKIAGLTEVPVRIRELDDQAVLEIQVIENLQREDVHPLEEANGFEALIRDYAYTAGAIAEKIGCHESYVHKRLRLARLIEPARKSFANGEISLNHAILLARLDSAEAQKQAFELCFEDHYDRVTRKSQKVAVPAKSLDLRIREEIFLDLTAAPWNKHDAELAKKAGSCVECPKRTGANGMLFDDGDGKRKDHCLDRECFETKRQAFVQIKIAELIEKTGEAPVRVANGYADDKTLKQLQAVRSYSYTIPGKKEKCEHQETAIVVYGDDIGKLFSICRAAKCPKHGTRHSSGAARSPQAEAAERKRKLDEKIIATYRSKLWLETWNKIANQGLDALEEANVDLIAHYLIQRIGHDGRAPLIKLLDLSLQKKDVNGYSDNAKLLGSYYDKLAPEKQIPFLVALTVAPALGSMYGGTPLKSLEGVAGRAGCDPVAIKRAIAAPLQAKAKASAAKAKKVSA
jgi:ParB family chromosome partitioning protein